MIHIWTNRNYDKDGNLTLQMFFENDHPAEYGEITIEPSELESDSLIKLLTVFRDKVEKEINRQINNLGG